MPEKYFKFFSFYVEGVLSEKTSEYKFGINLKMKEKEV
jgi:hypothetical protein